MSASSSPPEDGGGDDDVTYVIRDCQYRELSSIASLVVESFYDKKKVNLVARKLYQLAEMNRLQQNFPYPESRSVHRMLVVEAQKSTATTAGDDDDPVIVGFCDVDARPCATKLKLPRPYLSDLAIDPRHRRRGLARRLVEASEDFVRGNGDNSGGGIGSILGGSPKEQQKPPFDELWIRVASDNLVALGLYREKLGYSLADWSTGEEPNANKKSNEPEVWTLRKDLRE
jgi:ribosomal protein S18 acetylase RimI-like enzyme